MNRDTIKRRLIEQDAYTKKLLDKPLIPREHFSTYKKQLTTPLIKTILGPRRAGKTTLGLLLLKKENFYYINFDDEILSTIKRDDLGKVLELLNELFGKRPYLFLDEIQNIDSWELFVNRLQRLGYNIILSGSNSKLLSKELSSHLGGRTLTLEILPFSFNEFLAAKHLTVLQETDEEVGRIKNQLREYLRRGGYPEIITEISDSILRKKYLNELFDTIIFRDIMQRFNIKYTSELVALAMVIMNHFSTRTSLTKIAHDLEISSHTIKKYISYFEEAYLIFSSKKFSYKPREMESSFRKYYSVDTGLLHAKKTTITPDFGKLMENIVAIELKRRGIDLYYYIVDNKYEVDFVIGDVTAIKEVIQVVNDEQEMPLREIRTGMLACKKLHCHRLTIITWNAEEKKLEDGITIRSIPLWKWLMNQR
ncbi:MAG: ATP-binding protein [Candidatus Thermoplasmatota archaeon]